VRRDIKDWLNWLRNDIGFDGWRLDFVRWVPFWHLLIHLKFQNFSLVNYWDTEICFWICRGFSGTYVKEYIEASNPAFAIGEYWDSLAYEQGSLCYNQGNLW
jgi:alpha-amylase